MFNQVEIDEYREYDKALEALQESKKFLLKAGKDTAGLDRRIDAVATFVRAKGTVATDPAEFVRICYQLLDSRIEGAVPPGDIFGILIEYYYSVVKNYDEVYKLIEKMRSRGILTGHYLDQKVITTVHRHMGIPLAATDEDDRDGSGFVEEDVADD